MLLDLGVADYACYYTLFPISLNNHDIVGHFVHTLSRGGSMDTFTTEQGVRREAIRRHLQGEKPRDICRDLGRSLSWFDKWWAEYQQHP